MTEHCHGPHKPLRRLGLGLAFAAIASFFFAIGTLGAILLRPIERPYNPFGQFPVQLVAGDAVRNEQGVPIVSISRDKFITVEAQKCYKEAVEVVGTLYLQFVTPSGEALEISRGVVQRRAGCTYWLVSPEEDCPALAAECKVAFRNSIENATSRVETLTAQGIDVVVKIYGEETSTSGGVTQVFQSEEIILVP